MKYIATIEGTGQSTDFTIDVDRPTEVTIDGRTHRVDLRSIDGAHLYSLIVDERSYEMHVERSRGQYFVQIGGDRYVLEVEQERLKRLRAMGGQRHEEHGDAAVRAPMPGLVVRVFVEVDQHVEADQALVILEAMKMENEIRSPRAGIVSAIAAEPGSAVNKDDELVLIAPLEEVRPSDDAESGEHGARP